ncbi:type IV pilus modification protein PilV [Acinetobacter terrestris]|uniref:type IV pilus modification protein PilV n=1 Tax=Acinetobacter terrestris TaxID=2529843 RepID=UPI00103AF7F2|nr:type IV pilus modification protein PilV [Acinetobacter terrestris]TCB64481.1 type IV pilus modification protein PilV [Acinetobacter terrestris]
MRNSQNGVGLMEVLVALLLLAVGVLGYTALQVKAVEATTEATQRSQALFVLKGLAESIRANNAGRNVYLGLVNAAVPESVNSECINPEGTECTSAILARDDVRQAQVNARNFGIHLRMENCPGTATLPVGNRRNCLFAAWGETDITQNVRQCMNNTGIYVVGSNCIMMEAY